MTVAVQQTYLYNHRRREIQMVGQDGPYARSTNPHKSPQTEYLDGPSRRSVYPFNNTFKHIRIYFQTAHTSAHFLKNENLMQVPINNSRLTWVYLYKINHRTIYIISYGIFIPNATAHSPLKRSIKLTFSAQLYRKLTFDFFFGFFFWHEHLKWKSFHK